jgi:hypothetical protein
VIPDSFGQAAATSYLDDLLVGLIIDLYCSDGLLNIPKNHVQVLVVGLQQKEVL